MCNMYVCLRAYICLCVTFGFYSESSYTKNIAFFSFALFDYLLFKQFCIIALSCFHIGFSFSAGKRGIGKKSASAHSCSKQKFSLAVLNLDKPRYFQIRCLVLQSSAPKSATTHGVKIRITCDSKSST